MTVLTDAHRSAIGTEVGRLTVEVSRRDIQKYAAATEQTQLRFLRGDEAPVMFIFNLFNEIPTLQSLGPDGLPLATGMPELPLKRVMAGGTDIVQHRPIRPGDCLTGVREITDIYEKSGRSGPLIFVVRRLTVQSEHGEPVLVETQTRIVR